MVQPWQLCDALARDVMHQPEPTEFLGERVHKAWRHHMHPLGRYIDRALLSGPSGSGKTETIYRIRHYLGMDAGYAYEHCCIFIDASTSIDSMSSTRLTGVSGGFMGCTDKDSLPDRLNNALGGDGQQPPPVLLLFIDEIDKAHPNFLTAINGLLITGKMEAAHGRRLFSLPLETALLCLFTANYGDEAVSALPNACCYHLVKQAIEEAMKKRGLAECAIERFGLVVAYRALDREKLHLILMHKLAMYLEERAQLEVDDTVRKFLVQRVLVEVDIARGVRCGMRLLFAQLDRLFDVALGVLRSRVVMGQEYTVPLRLTHHLFRLDDAGAELTDVLQKALSRATNREEFDRQRAVAHHNKDLQEMHALAVHRDNEVLVANILPALALGLRDFVEETGQRVQQIKQVNRQLGNLVDEMMDVAQNHDGDTESLRGAIIEIGTRRKALRHRHSSDSSSSEEEKPMECFARHFRRHATGETASRNKRRQSIALTNRVEEIGADESGEEENENEKEEEEEEQVACNRCGVEYPLNSYGKSYYKTKDGSAKTTIRRTCGACLYAARKATQ